MVLFVIRFDILPDKQDKYTKWIKSFLEITYIVPAVEEFRAYRTIVSSQGHVVGTFEFKNLETWTQWRSHTEIQKFLDEMSKYVTNISTELWGPSPIVPEPIRPKNNP